MASDPRLQAAIAHWGPRFVANGVVLTDFEELTGSLKRYDQWCAAWSARAAHHEEIGREALKRGHQLTAGEAPATRRRLLSLRRISVCARRAADEGGAHEGGRVPEGGAAVPAAAR